jgi:hypothetical protein
MDREKNLSVIVLQHSAEGHRRRFFKPMYLLNYND